MALKVLRRHLSSDQAQTWVETEVTPLTKLQHPNIVAVYAVGAEGGTNFIAMEYIEGPTLADLIREQETLPSELIRHIFRQILQGLAAAYDAGLIHRDIKPSNILLDDLAADALSDAAAGVHEATSVTVKLADFGLARITSAQTRITMPGSPAGTPEYMSPEQARGEENIDHRTDLYSAGVVLYEMLTGRTPFNADIPSAVIYQILHTDPPDPRTLSEQVNPQLASLALRLMAKRPKDRFESSDDAIVVFDASKRIPSLERHRRYLWRSLCLIAAIALVCAVAWLSSLVGRQLVSPALEDRLIRDVDVDPDRPTVIRAWYAEEPDPRVFYSGFPREIGAVTAVDIVDPDGVSGTGDEFVVAGTARPMDGICLFTFNTSGDMLEPRWTLSSEREWPDCDSCQSLPLWHVKALAVADLDGERGDEIIVAAAHVHEYPARISIIDPRTAGVRSTFWHLGQMSGIHVEAGFFTDDTPAIIVWGQNNKLDGFGDPARRPYDRRPDEDKPRTEFPRVPVVMILDPAGMDGVGPPRSPDTGDLVGAVPYAYGFVDLPCTRGDYFPDGQPERIRASANELATIAEVKASKIYSNGITISGFEIAVAARCYLYVDRHLAFHEVLVDDSDPEQSQAYWRARWKPVIREGKYLSAP